MSDKHKDFMETEYFQKPSAEQEYLDLKIMLLVIVFDLIAIATMFFIP